MSVLCVDQLSNDVASNSAGTAVLMAEELGIPSKWEPATMRRCHGRDTRSTHPEFVRGRSASCVETGKPIAVVARSGSTRAPWELGGPRPDGSRGDKEGLPPVERALRRVDYQLRQGRRRVADGA